MSTSYIPTKFNDPNVKVQMTALKYRKEQELTCIEAIKNCLGREHVLELYAGTGGLTEIYKKNFTIVTTNDVNKNANTDFHNTAMNFIKLFLKKENNFPKLDLIDFDCYGSPALEIQEYFKQRRDFDAPFVLRFSDGLGLWMKRNKNQEVVKKRYLIDGELDMTKIWLRHPELIDAFLKRIAGLYGMQADKIISVQTKFKNYVLGAYKFTKIQ